MRIQLSVAGLSRLYQSISQLAQDLVD